MKNTVLTTLFWLVAAFVLFEMTPSASAQTFFGKNKVTYTTFDWHIYRAPHFDIYYYPSEEHLLPEIVSAFESAYLEVSEKLDHELKERVPAIIYRTHAEFEQTNVALAEIPEAVGAFAEPFKGRMVLPIDDPPDRRYALIKHELTHIFQFDILYAGSLRRVLRGQPPLWMMEGLASYIADDENSIDQMVIRDAVVNNLVPSVRNLSAFGFLTYRFGHALFDFVEETWGAEGVRTFLFEYRKVLLADAVDKAFIDAFGLTIEAFDRRFARFLRKRYLPVLVGKRSPDEYGKEIGLERPGKFTFSPALSPSGDLVAAMATPGLELDVVILSAKTGKVIRNLTKGMTNSYENIVVEAFSGQRDLAWSADGDRIAFFVTKERRRDLMIYDAVNGRRLARIRFDELANQASPAFSPDGRWIAFSANTNGYWDIFRFDLETGKIENLTKDNYYDSNPSWSPDGDAIIYNRRIGMFEKIFQVPIGSPSKKVQLSAGASSDIQPVFSRDGKLIYFASDRGEYGIFNIHRLDLATARIERLTDLAGGAFSPEELPPDEDGNSQILFTSFFSGTFRLFRMPLAGEEVVEAIEAGKREPQTSSRAPSRRLKREKKEQERRIREGKTSLSLPTDGILLRPIRLGVPVQPFAAVASIGATIGTTIVETPTSDGSKDLPSGDGDSSEGGDADLRPFKPLLDLRLDENKKEKYTLTWSVDTPDFTVGVTDDGQFLGNLGMTFSDMLGDQRVVIRSFTVSQFSNTDVAYYNLTRRYAWGARLIDYRDYYTFQDIGVSINQRIQRRTRYTSLEGFIHYPFNRNYRIESAVGYAQRRFDIPVSGGLDFVTFSDDFPYASVDFVGDTVRYRSFGPLQGHRFRLGFTHYQFISGDSSGTTLEEFRFDYRGYQHLTSSSLFAMRIAGVTTTGENALIRSVGGINQFRGLRYRELSGQTVLWANFELRFPLINYLQWGFGMFTGPFRANIFVDVATAWYDDVLRVSNPDECLLSPSSCVFETGKAAVDPETGLLRAYATKDAAGLYQDLYFSSGVGFSVPLFGLPMNWTFYRRYDGAEFSNWNSDFYIVYDW